MPSYTFGAERSTEREHAAEIAGFDARRAGVLDECSCAPRSRPTSPQGQGPDLLDGAGRPIRLEHLASRGLAHCEHRRRERSATQRRARRSRRARATSSGWTSGRADIVQSSQPLMASDVIFTESLARWRPRAARAMVAAEPEEQSASLARSAALDLRHRVHPMRRRPLPAAPAGGAAAGTGPDADVDVRRIRRGRSAR